MNKAIIFDFDDTLGDFRKVKRYAESVLGKYINKKYGKKYKISRKKFCKEFDNLDYKFVDIGKRLKELAFYNRILWLEQFFMNHDIDVSDKEIIKLVKLYWNAVNTKINLLPHAKEILIYLKNKGYKLAMLSDGDGTRTLKMDRINHTKITKYFDIIVTGDDINSTKPDIKFYKKILNKIKVKPKECIMVGDKPPFDLELAKKLGMKTIWIKYGRFYERNKKKRFDYVDYEIKDLKEIMKLI